MAASDYAQIVFDKNGKSVEACEFTVGRLNFEAYKSWLYIRCQEIWKKDESFMEPVIAQFSEGDLSLCGCDITGVSVDLKTKDGIPYNKVLIWTVSKGYGEEQEIYAGICCYAYLDHASFLAKKAGIPEDWTVSEVSGNVDPKTNEIGDKFYSYLECFPPNQPRGNNQAEWDAFFAQKKEIDISEHNDVLGLNSYCGITDDMIGALVKFLEDNYHTELAAKIKENKKISYRNQGDRTYFGGQSSIIGDTPERPILHQLLS